MIELTKVISVACVALLLRNATRTEKDEEWEVLLSYREAEGSTKIPFYIRHCDTIIRFCEKMQRVFLAAILVFMMNQHL